MSKFILSNNENVNDSFVGLLASAGFKNSQSHLIDSCIVSTFEKKRKPLKNFAKYDNGDFIAIIGTLVFNKKKKDEALEDIYNVFDRNNILELRARLLGNYIIAIRKNSEISIFTDKYNVISLFFYLEDDVFALSNSCWHLAKALDLKDIDQVALLEETMLISPVGRTTPFKKVKRIFGDAAVSITNSGKLDLFDLPVKDRYLHVKDFSFDEAINNYTQLINEEFSQLAAAYKGLSFGLQQTGGLDNRTIFAALMNLGVKPRTFYGVGNTVLTNTKTEDFNIVRLYKERFALDLHIMDWNHNWNQDKVNREEQVLQYGFSQTLYGGSSVFFAEFENKIAEMPDFMECGYYGEVLRQREWAYQREDSKKEGYTLDEFLNGYLFGPGYGGLHHDKFTNLFAKVRDKVTKDYEFELRKAHLSELDKDGNLFFSIDNWSKLEWMHMRNCNSRTVNFLNDYTSSIAMFATEKLHDFALNLPSRYLQNGSFQLAIIFKLFPMSLDVPILTHGIPHKFDKVSFRLERLDLENSSVNSKFKLSIVRFLLKYPKAFQFLINLRKSRKARNEELFIRKSFDSILHNNQEILSCNPKRYSGSLVYYGVLAQYVNAIALVSKDKI